MPLFRKKGISEALWTGTFGLGRDVQAAQMLRLVFE